MGDLLDVPLEDPELLEDTVRGRRTDRGREPLATRRAAAQAVIDRLLQGQPLPARPEHEPQRPARGSPQQGAEASYVSWAATRVGNRSILPLSVPGADCRPSPPSWLVDGTGKPLVIALTAGQAGDFPILRDLAARPHRRPTRPETARLNAGLRDKAYSSRTNRDLLRRRPIATVIPQPNDRSLTAHAWSYRWPPPTFDHNAYCGRNVVERSFHRSQAVAWPDHPLLQAHHHLPRRRRAPRDHPVAMRMGRYARGAVDPGVVALVPDSCQGCRGRRTFTLRRQRLGPARAESGVGSSHL